MNNNNNQNNPWKKIVENYQEQVEEADTKGYADFYKRCTEHYLFKFIPSRLQEVGLTFTPIDIEYDDGYYLQTHYDYSALGNDYAHLETIATTLASLNVGDTVLSMLRKRGHSV